MTQDSTGFFVVLDGIDGCGKSTQAVRLTRELTARGHEVVHLREPGSTPFGESLRKILLDKDLERGPNAEILTFFAARAELLRQVILPALRRGAVVVCERWVSSTLAYQAAGASEGLALVTELERSLIQRGPDRVFILDLTPELARGRMKPTLDGIEGRGAAYFARVRAGFLDYAATRPNAVVLDAGLPEAAIASQILTRVLDGLG